MTRTITAKPLTSAAFATFGEVIEKGAGEVRAINGGMCERHHDLANIEIHGKDGRPSINIFAGKPYALPLKLALVERHPLGSQAFIPLHNRPFLVIVCDDENGIPGRPHAFITAPGQGVNYRAGQWHGVLATIGEPGDFVVIDRAGEGENLEEYVFDEPWLIKVPES